jgi:DNA-binding transcriptional MerR regulator
MSETSEGRIRIGRLARRCGVSPDTLRHYERLGLLCVAARGASGYRFYAPEAVTRVSVIQAALSLGFTLAELSRLFGMSDRGQPPCRAVRELAAQKLNALEQSLQDLRRLRAGLRVVLRSWDARLACTPTGGRSGLLEALGSGEIRVDLPERVGIGNRPRKRRNT